MQPIKSLSLARKIGACVLTVLLLATMSMIFFLSSEDAATSSDRSNPIASVVVDVEEQHSNLGRPMIPEEKKDAIADMQFWVRGAAHFLEFFLLGWLACALLLTVRIKPWLSVLLAGVFGILYAISDEVHQKFVPGRSAAMSDVLLDSGGVLCGVLIAALMVQAVVWLLARRSRRKTVCN